MAGLLWHVAPMTEVGLVAATPKCVLQVKAAATVGLKIQELGVMFDGVSPTGEPIVIEALSSSTDGTSTAITTTYSATNGQIKKTNDVSWAAQLSAGYNFSAEPTLDGLYRRWEVHPQAGIDLLLPLGREIIIPPSGRFNIRCTAPANVNCSPFIAGEE